MRSPVLLSSSMIVIASLQLAAILTFDQQRTCQAFTSSTNSIFGGRNLPLMVPDHFASSSYQPLFLSLDEGENGGDNSNDDSDDEAELLRQKAKDLREQIREMESKLPDDRKKAREELPPPTTPTPSRPQTPLSGARVLVAGANGRLGSMVCRYLLREVPEIKELIAMVHVVGENSPTARGYGRLAYEVGAEDGIGTIGPAWSSAEERTQSFEFDAETMTDYNLQKIRIVECELLDPVQCKSVMEDSQADVVVWCATDYNGNRPRAVGTLNVAFLFRALAAPDKGRVEVEGLQNMLGAIKTVRQEAMQRRRLDGLSMDTVEDEDTEDDKKNRPVDILLVSMAPNALNDFETPFGTFYDVKRQGEDMISNEFPSLSYTVLQMGQYEDNFVDEGLELKFEDQEPSSSSSSTTTSSSSSPLSSTSSNDGSNADMDDGSAAAAASSVASTTVTETGTEAETETTPRIGVRRINRRDAARAVAEALNRPDLRKSKVQVWTSEVGGGK